MAALPLGLLLLASLASAQSSAPKFDVASVKMRKPGAAFHFEECTGDRFWFSGPALGNLLQWAYHMPSWNAFQQFKRSASIPLEFYEIQAKVPGRIESRAQCRLMVQALLADRFKVSVHWEEIEGDVFDLVVMRGGPKMQKALDTDEGAGVTIAIDGVVIALPVFPASEGHKGLTMEELVEYLPMDGPVTDRTGLEGRYKIDLRYARRISVDAVDPPNGSSMEAALAKLGLRLEKHKGMIKVPILDHLERPDED